MPTAVESPVVPWMYPRPVSQLPTSRVNGRVAEKLPGETLQLDQEIHQPLWGTVSRGIGGGAVIASPSAHYPVVLPFGGCCGLGTNGENGATQNGSGTIPFFGILAAMFVGGLAILWLTRKEEIVI